MFLFIWNCSPTIVRFIMFQRLSCQSSEDVDCWERYCVHVGALSSMWSGSNMTFYYILIQMKKEIVKQFYIWRLYIFYMKFSIRCHLRYNLPIGLIQSRFPLIFHSFEKWQYLCCLSFMVSCVFSEVQPSVVPQNVLILVRFTFLSCGFH